MRGKEGLFAGNQGEERITPAYAGKSITGYWNLVAVEDHPRLCGEKSSIHTLGKKQSGSPPPMRGKEGKLENLTDSVRITPAYAGKSD